MKILHKIVRINQLLHINLVINLYKYIENSSIIILKNGSIIDPVFIENGFIKNRKIFINSNNVVVNIPYSNGEFEIIWSYPSNDIILSESKIITIELIDVQKTNQENKHIFNNTIKTHYNFHDLSKWLTVDNTFGWRAIISFDEDIKIRFIKKGSEAVLCLGEKSYCINHSDYLFKVNDNQTEINIPNSLIHKLDDKNIACFILCKGDFYNIDNLYYKIPISNFVRFITSSLSTEITDPLGNILNV